MQYGTSMVFFFYLVGVIMIDYIDAMPFEMYQNSSCIGAVVRGSDDSVWWYHAT